jgi:hypothetical protein
MPDDNEAFDFISAVPTAELAKLCRRVTFLEAAIVQFLRDKNRLKEWFSAGELAALSLPGLPRTASGIARLAQRQLWDAKITHGRGGERVLYHFSSLPRLPWAAFIDLVVRGDLDDQPPPAPASAEAFPALPATGLAAPARAPRPAATPAWVLPLMRLMRGGSTSLQDALRDLPAKAPAGTRCPSYAEALDVLRGLGVIAG